MINIEIGLYCYLYLRKRDSSTPALQSLHWLPIHSRIIFKILLQTFQCSLGSGPTYLKDLLTPYTPTRNLRSANKDTLVIPKVTTKAYGQRSYQFAAPHLWNNLPLHIKQATTISSFKTLLKTYLFKSSYT